MTLDELLKEQGHEELTKSGLIVEFPKDSKLLWDFSYPSISDTGRFARLGERIRHKEVKASDWVPTEEIKVVEQYKLPTYKDQQDPVEITTYSNAATQEDLENVMVKVEERLQNFIENQQSADKPAKKKAASAKK